MRHKKSRSLLFELDAEDFVRQQHTCMYPLLVTMNNVRADLIAQVMQELVHLYRDDEVTLAEQLILMELLLERTDTVPDVEKEKIGERLNMFDRLWDESPRVQRLREKLRKDILEEYRVQLLQEGLQKGRQEGLQGFRRLLVSAVQAK